MSMVMKHILTCNPPRRQFAPAAEISVEELRGRCHRSLDAWTAIFVSFVVVIFFGSLKQTCFSFFGEKERTLIFWLFWGSFFVWTTKVCLGQTIGGHESQVQTGSDRKSSREADEYHYYLMSSGIAHEFAPNLWIDVELFIMMQSSEQHPIQPNETNMRVLLHMVQPIELIVE